MARRVAVGLGIPHYVFDVEEDFTRDVIDDFVDEYASGRTPNPCVRCNSSVKFRDLLARGRALGCERVASGHYARSVHGPVESSLLRGLDHAKDQSYFLWGLPRTMLPLLHFPLGALTKPEVRARARTLGLDVDFRQSNSEGQLVDWIQEAREKACGIVLNAGAYTHTSVAILDALNAAERPVIELHLSNVFRREGFRHHSYVSLAAQGVICGFGAKGYELAVEAMADIVAGKQADPANRPGKA